MAAFFTIGEKKTRPGVYARYENYGAPPAAGADDGKCAAVFKSNWGPVGKAMLLENISDVDKIYGGGGKDGTAATAKEQFRGGARAVYALRLGAGGTRGELELKDSTGSPAAKLTLKHPGSRAFSLSIRPALGDPGETEVLLQEGTNVLERLAFAAPADGDYAAALISAAESSPSEYYTLQKIAGGTGALATLAQAPIAPGTDPDASVSAYSEAFLALEPHRWSVLSVDTSDPAIHLLAQGFLNRIYKDGMMAMGVLAEPSTGAGKVPFEDRLAHASAFNDYQIVYVGNGWADMAGNVYDGWPAAARVAGMIAGTPSRDSISRGGGVIVGAVGLTETLTNAQYERAIKAGMLTFSTSSAGAVWVEQGINTLVAPGAKEDEGWKKIKRVKIRFELMQRVNDTVEGLIGRINNDTDGRATIIQLSNSVLNAMVAENKLLAGARCEPDAANPPQGDSAWFIVSADDIDSLEKMYFTFKFRFAPGEAAA